MISVATVLSWLGLTGTVDADRDAQLQQLIDAATGTLGRELGRYLGTPAATEEIQRGGVALVVLYDDPTDPDDVLVETRASITSPWEEADAADYTLEGRRLQHSCRWPGGKYPGVRSTYERGYEPDAGPAELCELVRKLVVGTWQGRAVNAAMQSESLGDYSYTRRDLEGVADWPAVSGRWRRQPV